MIIRAKKNYTIYIFIDITFKLRIEIDLISFHIHKISTHVKLCNILEIIIYINDTI